MDKRGEEVIKIGTIPVNAKTQQEQEIFMPQGFFMALPMNESLENCGLYGAILSGKVIEIPEQGLLQNGRIRKMIEEIKITE